MANTSTPRTQPNSAHPEIAFYIAGVRAPSDRELTDYVLSTANGQHLGLVPTTYEESKAYLEGPAGQENPLREMCMIGALDIPENQDIVLVIEALGILLEFKSGANLFLPTMWVPPNAFGTRKDPTSTLLLNTTTSKPVRFDEVMVFTTYFTKKSEASGTDTSLPESKEKKKNKKKKTKKKKGTGEEKGEGEGEEEGEEKGEEEGADKELEAPM